MPAAVAVTAEEPLLPGRSVQARAPLPASPADVVGIELERVADRHEGEGTGGVVGREPRRDLREETSRSGAPVPRPAVVREDGVGQHRDLKAFLRLDPGTSEGSVAELLGQDTLWCE